MVSRQFSPEDLQRLEEALAKHAAAGEPVIKALSDCIDQGRRPDDADPALRRYDRTSVKLADRVNPKSPEERNRVLDAKYCWAADPHSKRELREALGIDKGHFHKLLAEHCPGSTRRGILNVPFECATRLLKARLTSVSVAKARAFKTGLDSNETLRGCDPERVRKLGQMLSRRLKEG
jgi:hypothetical protein